MSRVTAAVASCLLCGLLLASAQASGTTTATGPIEKVQLPGDTASFKTPRLDSRLAAVQQEAATKGNSAALALAKESGLTVREGRVVVVIQGADLQHARSTAARAGGVAVQATGSLVRADVPPDNLLSLSAGISTGYVRPPYTPVPQAISEGVASTGAAAWQQNGRTGAAARVAVVDIGFAGYESAEIAGDLPTVTTVNYCADGIGEAGAHGTAVAETIHEMAPDAELTLICVDDEIGLAEAEQYAASNGIRIVNHSVNWFGEPSRGDGTGAPGTPAAIVAQAMTDGILWVNAAGDYAQLHWSGTFRDGNHDGWEDFTQRDEGNSFYVAEGASACVNLQWDSWPTSAQDFDLYVFDEYGRVSASSTNVQNGTQPPIENACFTNNGESQWFFAAINKFAATSTPRFDMFVSGDVDSVQYATPAGSVAEPATSPDVLAVGAVCWSQRNLETYSSRGPTIDHRSKPDIVAPDSVSNPVYGAADGCGTSGFVGTSAAAPHVAGAAALIEGLHPAWTVDEVRAYLIASARSLGSRNLFGAGGLWLPAMGEPVVKSFTPAAGPVGTTVTISGSDLADPDNVTFDGVSAAVVSSTATTVKAVVPIGASTGQVVVTTGDGVATSAASFKVSPTISGFAPADVLPGGQVTITGLNFSGATSVEFGRAAATHYSVDDDTQITATVPPGAASARITVATPAGSATSAESLGVAETASIRHFVPAAGPVGSTVTVTGSHLDTVTLATVGGVDVGSLIHTAAKLVFTVPTGASTGAIAVTNPAGTATSTTPFKVSPTVADFAPSTAPPGTEVTISGSNFTGTTNIRFGSVTAPDFTVIDDSNIKVLVPPSAVSAPVRVTTPAGTGTSSTPFVVALTATVSRFSPSAGPVGSRVVVTGSHLDSVTAAALGGVDVGPLTHVSATKLSFAVPIGASTGHIGVTNANGTSLTDREFAVTPTVSAFEPAQAAPGSEVTIDGFNFTEATGVKFGVVSATTFTVEDDSHIVAEVPLTASTSLVTVTTPAGAGTSTQAFGVEQTPRLISFHPSAGPAGSVVNVTGTSLDAVTSATLGGVSVGSLTHDGTTGLSFVVPPNAVSGPIALDSPAGATQSTNEFTVTLAITALNPLSGPRLSYVDIQGSGMGAVTGVKFGDVATTFMIDSPSELTAQVPWDAPATAVITLAADDSEIQSSQTFSVLFPPANDSFDQSGQIDELPFSASADASYATTETGEPPSCAGGGTLWWSWTAPSSGGIVVDAVGSTGSTHSVDVYDETGSGLSGLRNLGCDVHALTHPSVETRVTAGETYYFQVANTYGSTVDIHVDWIEVDGNLDTSFGDGGVATLDVTPSHSDFGSAVAIQPDGKIVVAGLGGEAGSITPYVTRFNANGTLDTSFGTGGVTTVALGTGGSVGDIIAGVEIEADGSIFVIGSGDSRTGEIELARLTSGGAPDESFGAGGLATTVVGPCGHADSAMSSPDGKVLVAGHTCTGAFVIRFNADGTVDTTFGSNGVFTDDPVGVPGTNLWTVGAIGMDPFGRVVITGTVTVLTTVKSKDFVARLTADGALDTTFGNGGSVVGLFGPFTALGFDASGRIIVGGGQVYRLNPDGSLDSTFGTNGLVYVKSLPVAIEVDSQNRIVVIERSDGRESVFQRFATDGSPDPTFGPGGELLTSGWGWAAAVIEADGTAVVVGANEGGPSGDSASDVLAIGRYTLGPAF